MLSNIYMKKPFLFYKAFLISNIQKKLEMKKFRNNLKIYQSESMAD